MSIIKDGEENSLTDVRLSAVRITKSYASFEEAMTKLTDRDLACGLVIEMGTKAVKYRTILLNEEY